MAPYMSSSLNQLDHWKDNTILWFDQLSFFNIYLLSPSPTFMPNFSLLGSKMFLRTY